MENTLWQSILNYGGLGVLTVLFFLFAKGYIVSKNTLEQAISSHKATIERIVTENTLQRQAYEKTIDMIAKSHSITVDKLCDNYKQTITELKTIIQAAKNGSKKVKE